MTFPITPDSSARAPHEEGGARAEVRRRKCSASGCRHIVLCEGLDVCGGHVQEQLGITYRMLDYWARQGWLHPESRGTGYPRAWPQAELDIARRMGGLVRSGLTVAAAAEVARHGRSPHPAGTAHGDWRDQALCAETDPEIFFPVKGGSDSAAKLVCRRCEVRAECLEYALATDQRNGIWGGHGTRERDRLLAHRIREGAVA
jgi:WhiB family redox-sensing transcriptional regulator